MQQTQNVQPEQQKLHIQLHMEAQVHVMHVIQDIILEQVLHHAHNVQQDIEMGQLLHHKTIVLDQSQQDII
jgi:hypothetical protein